MLHLHTKKSLYTGSDRSSWRESLYSGLLQSPELVDVILNRFDADPSLGLFYPEIAKGMPYWAHHWLSNEGVGRYLLKRLGLEDCFSRRYLDYPVGGMFWARVDAIRPLMEVGLTYDDFPSESGQTDGTLAHAIERAIGLVSSARGYRFVTYDADDQLFRENWSARNFEQYRNASKSAFDSLLKDVDLVSFDIFDTLLSRPALEPDSVLRYVDHVVAARVRVTSCGCAPCLRVRHAAPGKVAFRGTLAVAVARKISGWQGARAGVVARQTIH